MYVEGFVPECDLTKVKYPSVVKGAHVVARGATGRYCAVLYVGPEAIAEQGLKVITAKEAYAIVEKEGGYADF
jgi:hypothetical protein